MRHFFSSLPLVKHLFMAIVMITMVYDGRTEGTPSVWKNYSGVALSDESGGIFVNFNPDPVNGLYEAYTYGSDTLNRLYVHVKDHTAEDIYFGFNVRRLWFVGCGTGNTTGDYTAASGNVVYWRLRDPNGVAVDSGSIAAYNGGTAASTATGYIGNYTQAANGPDGVDGVGTAGYTPETYNPTANGDYYFEFNYRDQTTPYDASSCTRSTIDFQYFDISIVDGTSSIKGRLWSRQWSLVTVNRAPNQAIATNSSKIHVYTDDSIITRVDFDTISPGNWNIIANENGIGTSGNFELDVRSTSSPATELNRKNKLFLNTPDTNIYPTKQLAKTVTETYIQKCDTFDQCIMVDLNRPSDVNVYIEVNDTAGYQLGGADVLLSDVAVTKGLNCIPWDGLDGNGNLIPDGDTIFIQILFGSDVTQLPLQDIESNPNGIKVTLELPISGYTTAYWNDSLIGGATELTGCIYTGSGQGCHDWTGDFSSGLGNGNVINTYWYSTLDTLVPIVVIDSIVRIEIEEDTLDYACVNDPDTVDPGPITLTAFNGPPNTNFRWTTTGGGTFVPHDSTLSADYLPTADEILYGGTLKLFLKLRVGCPDVVDSVVVDFGKRPGGVDYFISSWLKANEGPLNSGSTAATNGQAVDSWFDMTNKGNDADAVVTGPTFSTLGINNNPTLIFNDDDDERLLMNLSLGGNEVVFAAVTQANTTSNTYLGDASSPDLRRLFGDGTNPQLRYNGATTATSSFDIDDDRSLIASFEVGTSSNERFWVNGLNAYDQEFGAIPTTNSLLIGNNSSLANELDGTVSEVIVYDKILSTQQRHQVESYLAIKYGVTLTHNYRDANGDRLFRADGAGGTFAYDYDIGGIGQNLCRMALSQPKSMSVNSDAVVQMGNPSSLDDFDYLIWGNNDSSLAVLDSVDVPSYYVDKRLSRIWNVDTTGDIGTVTLAFYLGNIPNSTTELYKYALLINDTTEMSTSWVANYDRAISNDTLYFYEVQFADNDFFTLGVDLLDSDKDSIPDVNDIDDDDDGIPDTLEIASGTDPTLDHDRDGVPDFLDPDFPGCGSVATGVCANFDTDKDSIPDHLDRDSDNDGIPDIVEAGGVDTNGDGEIDTNADADGDGLHDPYDPTTGGNSITNADSDGDGKRDQVDLDADNDGIPDVVESGGTDSDGDGIADNYSDSDDDGFNDVVDGDVGNDGITENTANGQQVTGPDTNNDGVPDSFDDDTDGDGIRDQIDLDADDDGIPDVVEVGGTDTDGDGRADNYVDTDDDGFNDVVDGDVGNDGTAENTSNAEQLTGADTNNDGVPNSYPEDDTDGDGIRDQLDLDADDDGIPDVVEAGGTDTDGDGRADNYVDTDNDGFNDVVDGDVGNDGTSENTANTEQLTGADTNNDGVPNSYPDDDTDGDGIRDQLDLDADNDGIPDVVEAGGTDTDGDGLADNYVDTDSDGFNDVVDGDVGNDGTSENTANAQQVTGSDTNNDGVPNSYPEDDTDGDGIRDQLDLDADNDGIPDVVEAGGTDTDGDGLADNYVDTDSDGFNDVVDGDVGNDGTSENTANAEQITGSDTNNDGVPNSYPEDDTDGDGIRDQLDLDADDDGIPDVVEVGGTDTDGDGRADNYVDTDNDGFNDVVDGDVGNDGTSENTANAEQITGADTNNDGVPNSYPEDDTDGDGIRDQLDLDADNDGIPDVVESGGTDTDGDGIADNYADTDADGFNDLVDGDVGNDGTAESSANAQQITGADTNSDGAPDSVVSDDFDNDGIPSQLDIDADGDGIVDVREVFGSDTDFDGRVDGNATDTDNDGFADSVDGDVGNDGTAENAANALLRTGSDTNSDGAPNSYPNKDSDSDGLTDQVDIDADNDGIVDNSEAQATASYIAPAGSDTDLDGLDNAYDSDNSGTYIIPVDTDLDTQADYLDLNSDDDSEVDVIEGHDTDGDGVGDAGSPANTGLAGGTTDTDGDGLYDGWDNNTSSRDATNSSLTPTSHPDYDLGDSERDWREIPCEGGTVVLTPDNSTTVASDYCLLDPWTYYYDPADPTELLFAIQHKPAGGNTNDFTAEISLTVSSDPDTEPGVYNVTDALNEQATFVKGRYWNVNITSGALNGDVNIRFYYHTDDSDTLEAVAERWNDNNAGSTAFVSGRRWFTMNTGTFDPSSGDLTAAGIAGSQELFPVTTDTEDGVTYVQFDGIDTLTGGGQAYTIGVNSVILPVELLSFNANLENDFVRCTWITASEINSDYFEVERSLDKVSWERIGQVKAAGNSSEKLDYSLDDLNPNHGESYYRLKSIDQDQSYKYSQTEKVVWTNDLESSASIYPNPNSGSFTVLLPGDENDGVIEIMDATGKLIRRINVKGDNRVIVSGIAAGFYLVAISTPASRVVFDVIVNH